MARRRANNPSKSTVGYVRRSTDRQEQSIQDQKKAIEGYKEFISNKYNGAEIIIHLADEKEIYDPQNKASKARPMKPALLLE